MAGKEITLIFYRQNHTKDNWRLDLSDPSIVRLLDELAGDLARCGVILSRVDSDAFTIDIASYADLLNSVRISSPADGFSSLCVGHIIGKSQNLDLMEDIRRAVSRIAFAPETVPPDDQNRKVCHNCGCGC